MLLENNTLITGDLIRSHVAGELCLLPATKLTDIDLAHKSVARLANLPVIDAVLTGDGWPIFNYGSEALKRLLDHIKLVKTGNR